MTGVVRFAEAITQNEYVLGEDERLPELCPNCGIDMTRFKVNKLTRYAHIFKPSVSCEHEGEWGK